MYCCHAIVVTSFALYKYLFSSCTKMLEILFRCPFLSFLFLDFPPKICMWRLCLTHVTCRFGPTIIVGLRIQIVKFVNIQHPITIVLHTKFSPAPTSQTPPACFPLAPGSRISHPYYTRASILTFYAGGWNKEDSKVLANIPRIYFAYNLSSKLNFLALLSQIFVLRHLLKVF